jgi:hypothetical protein
MPNRVDPSQYSQTVISRTPPERRDQPPTLPVEHAPGEPPLDADKLVSKKMLVLAMTLSGGTRKEIAEALHLQERNVGSLLWQLRKEGRLGPKEMAERMAFRTDFLALETVEKLLEDESVEPEVRLKAALEHLKGKGHYQSFTALTSHVDSTVQTTLAVRFEVAEGENPEIVEGAVLGTPEVGPPTNEGDA